MNLNQNLESQLSQESSAGSSETWFGRQPPPRGLSWRPTRVARGWTGSRGEEGGRDAVGDAARAAPTSGGEGQ